MTAGRPCREVAAAMSDQDLTDAITILGPDSALLPAVRDEIRARLTARLADPIRKEPA